MGRILVKQWLWFGLFAGLIGVVAQASEPPPKRPTCMTSACHSEFTKNAVVHGPIKGNGCTVCHQVDSPKHPGKPVAGHPEHPKLVPTTPTTTNATCLVCHDNLAEELQKNRERESSTHKPIQERSCVACHNPHGGKQKGLFADKKAPDTCFGCHKDIAELAKNGAVKHSVVTEKKACLQCHLPHSSSRDHLLKARTGDLCLECHAQEQKAKDGRVIKNITLDDGKIPSHKGVLDTACSTCHNPHGSNLDHLLRPGPFTFSKVPKVEAKAADCVECHTKTTPMAVRTWSGSLHAQMGITCITCHEVKKEDPGYTHHDVRITMIVTPKVCGTCHKNELSEMAKSPHGAPIPGHEVLQTNGKPDAKHWPMPPVGRINPDGSAGSCTICHSRHDFQAENARRPSVCLSCHLADGAGDAWQRSAHGAAYRDPLVTPKGLVTGAEIKVPSCVTCHMSENGSGVRLTHDVSSRLAWKISKDGKTFAKRPDADAHRDVMMDTCTQCHGSTFAEDAFLRIDESFQKGMPEKSFSPGASYLNQPNAMPHLSPTDRAKLSGE